MRTFSCGGAASWAARWARWLPWMLCADAGLAIAAGIRVASRSGACRAGRGIGDQGIVSPESLGAGAGIGLNPRSCGPDPAGRIGELSETAPADDPAPVQQPD